MDFVDYEPPDDISVSNRPPDICPYCKREGDFDVWGKHGEDAYLHKCPDCELQFATFLPGVELDPSF
jgi:hypothetical protein